MKLLLNFMVTYYRRDHKMARVNSKTLLYFTLPYLPLHTLRGVLCRKHNIYKLSCCERFKEKGNEQKTVDHDYQLGGFNAHSFFFLVPFF